MENLSNLSFMLVGSGTLTMTSVGSSEPTLVLINNKLIKASNIVQPQLKLAGLNGPASLGELVVLEAQLTDECPQFIKNAKIKWTVTEKGQPKQCWNDGKKIIFGAGVTATSINVTAEITMTYDVSGEMVQKTIKAIQVVQVGSTPDPVTPNSGTAALVAGWAKDPSIVSADNMTRGAQALSTSFKKISQSIGTEGLVKISDILVKTKSSNNDALIAVGVDPRAWDSWGKKLQDYLYNEYVAKNMFYDISLGLWSVK